jgi:hypothetical protein
MFFKGLVSLTRSYKKRQRATLSFLSKRCLVLLDWWFFKPLKGIEPETSIHNLLSPMTKHPNRATQRLWYLTLWTSNLNLFSNHLNRHLNIRNKPIQDNRFLYLFCSPWPWNLIRIASILGLSTWIKIKLRKDYPREKKKVALYR